VIVCQGGSFSTTDCTAVRNPVVGRVDSPDGADVCPPPELFDYPQQTQRKARARDNYFRKAKLWRVARAAFAAADYFVFLDLSRIGWPSLSAERLAKFERQLEQERPVVAVPLHPCNAAEGVCAPARAGASRDARQLEFHRSAARFFRVVNLLLKPCKCVEDFK
jgi:hypothetical protein